MQASHDDNVRNKENSMAWAYTATYILIIKPTRCTISQIYFWNRTLHVSKSVSVHHQESSTVHTAVGICHTGYADCGQHNLCDIHLLLCV